MPWSVRGGASKSINSNYLGAWKFPRVAFSRRGVEVLLDSEILTFRGNTTLYTRLTFALTDVPSFRLHVYPQGIGAAIRAMLGVQDVQVGVSDFDDRFVVKTDNELLARSLLNYEVQRALLGLKQWTAQVFSSQGHTELLIQDGSLRVRIRRLVARLEDLTEFYRLGGEVFDAVERAL